MEILLGHHMPRMSIDEYLKIVDNALREALKAME